MDLTTLLSLCHSYSDMGSSVTDQLHDMNDGEDPGELNGNAVRIIRRWLLVVRESLDEDGQADIDEMLETYSDEELIKANALCA